MTLPGSSPTEWLALPGDRLASPLGKPWRTRSSRRVAFAGAADPFARRGFIVLGPLAPGRFLRPTVAHGYVQGSHVEVVHGDLGADELLALRGYWGLPAC